MLLRNAIRLGAPVSAFGLARLGSIYSPLVIDVTHLDFLLSCRTSACSGLAPSAFNVGRPGFLVPLRSLARPDFSMLVLQSAHLGVLVPSRGHNRVESLVFILGTTRAGSVSLPPVLDHLHPDALLSPRSAACTESFVFALDSLRLGMLPSLHTHA